MMVHVILKVVQVVLISDAANYDADATLDDGTCSYEVVQFLTFDAYAFNSFSFNVDIQSTPISGHFLWKSDILLAVK